MASCHWRERTLPNLVALLTGFALYAVSTQLPRNHMYIPPSAVTDYGYPLATETVPAPLLAVLAVGGPMIVYVVSTILRWTTRGELVECMLCFGIALAWNEFVSELLKVTVGRPRPDFFGRCVGNSQLPPSDSNVVWDMPGYPLCTGSADVMDQAYLSFPSGHSSTAFLGLSQLTLFLIWKLGIFKKPASGLAYLLAFAPLVLATWIAATRVINMWHFPTDVVAGGLLGLGVSTTVWGAQFGSVLGVCEQHVNPASGEAEIDAL